MHHEADELIERFQLAEIRDQYHGSYNIAPSQLVPVITLQHHQRILETMRWGLIPSWAKDITIGYKMINARAEGIETKPAFRSAIKHRRCLIPVDGFYEWRSAETGKSKTPFFISVSNQSVSAFAGLWEEWASPETSKPLHSFTVITTSANDQMTPIHQRMPVILRPEDEAKWLDPSVAVAEVLPLLHPYENELRMYPVSTAVNSPKNNGKELITKIDDQEPNTTDNTRQLELF